VSGTLILAHGDLVPVPQLGSAWTAEPLVIALAVLGLVLFGQAFVRLRNRDRADLAGWWRAAVFGLGVAVLTLALLSPLDAIGEEYLISAHMLQHVLIGDVAPALILLAVAGPLLFFLLPAPLLGPLARATWLRTALRTITRPRVAFAIWALVFAVWHVPAVYDYVLTNRWAHDLQHGFFLLAGFLVWYVLIDPARHGTLTRSGRLGFALALFAAGEILSMVLIFSFDPLYPAYAAQDERLLGLSPLADQRLAGIVMMVEQIVTLGTCAALLLLAADRELRSGEEPAQISAGPRP
jgi:putative membrane protein